MTSTIADMVAFVERLGKENKINPRLAAQLASSVRRVAEVEPSWEQMDVKQLNVDALLQRFAQEKASSYGKTSLEEYQRRFRRVVNMYLDYLANPEGWQPAIRRGRPPKSKTAVTAKRGRTAATAAPAASAPAPVGEVRVVEYPFPLRASLVIKLSLPSDLRKAEVERLSAFLRTLTVD